MRVGQGSLASARGEAGEAVVGPGHGESWAQRGASTCGYQNAAVGVGFVEEGSTQRYE
jgi:hypothetical protein